MYEPIIPFLEIGIASGNVKSPGYAKVVEWISEGRSYLYNAGKKGLMCGRTSYLGRARVRLRIIVTVIVGMVHDIFD